MADPQLRSVPPLQRPLLLLAIVVTTLALALGLTSTDERLLLVPAAIALVWAAAYRAQPEEGVRQIRNTSQGVVVVHRTPPINARPRREMPPTPSEFAPAAAIAKSQAKSQAKSPGGRLIKQYVVGLPDRPVTPEAATKRRRRRKGQGGEGDEGGGKPTLGL